MAQFDSQNHALVGLGGSLSVRDDDEIAHKLLMLMEGECETSGPLQAAAKFGFSKQRYFQLRMLFEQAGAIALQNQKRGPKTHYRRTAEVVRQVIRHRFLDGDASPEVIAQKLRQSGWVISTRSVERSGRLASRPPYDDDIRQHPGRHLLAEPRVLVRVDLR